MQEDLVLFYVTNPSKEEAERIARHLLEKKLIACANIHPVQSIYRWKGCIEEGSEHVLIAKTLPARADETEKEIRSVHSYEIPCIIRFAAKANKEYLDWVGGSL